MIPSSRIRRACLCGIAAIGFSAVVDRARAETPIAEFGTDFTLSGPGPGWSFLWNGNGPIGSGSVGFPNNYVPLVRDASGSYIAPGTTVKISPAPDAASMPGIVPGTGTSQGDRIERFAIIAYTLSAADIAAYGGGVQMFPYRFAVLDTSATQTSDGIRSAIYANASRVIQMDLPPEFVYDSSAPDAYSVSIGLLRPGDTIYSATGSRFNNTGDRLDMTFTLSLASALKVIAANGILLFGDNVAATANTVGVNLTTHDAVYSYGDPERQTAYEQFRQWIVQGQSGFGGIYTSSPTVPGTAVPAVIAPVDNHELHLSEFGGMPVAAADIYNQILLKYTYSGDVNLDGIVSEEDYVNVIANMGRAGSYFDGDANLDGIVSAADYDLVTMYLGAGTSSGAPLAAVPTAVVPEPAAAGLVSTALLLAGRRRRS